MIDVELVLSEINRVEFTEEQNGTRNFQQHLNKDWEVEVCAAWTLPQASVVVFFGAVLPDAQTFVELKRKLYIVEYAYACVYVSCLV